jgi:LPS export ABC transporter protein LptC
VSGIDRQAVVFPVLAVLAVIAAWLTIAGFREPASEAADLTAERPRYHIEGARWQRYDERGTPLFELTARDVDYFDDASMEMTDIDLKTLGASHWTLSAARGSVAAGQEILKLHPQVDLQGQSREQRPLAMQTPSLFVNWNARTLDTDDSVIARSLGQTLDAVGMHADWAAEKVSFKSQVRVRHEPAR